MEKLLEKQAWIAREKSMFGKPGTDYDFGAQDAREARQQLEAKLAEQKKSVMPYTPLSIVYSLLHLYN